MKQPTESTIIGTVTVKRMTVGDPRYKLLPGNMRTRGKPHRYMAGLVFNVSKFSETHVVIVRGDGVLVHICDSMCITAFVFTPAQKA
jgi:hypothetical protein